VAAIGLGIPTYGAFSGEPWEFLRSLAEFLRGGRGPVPPAPGAAAADTREGTELVRSLLDGQIAERTVG
jgi:hypothetical protein